MTLEAWATVAGGVVVVGGVLIAGLRAAWTWSRKIGRFLDSWFGHDGSRSIPQRITALEAQVGKLDKYVTPNGGGSIYDGVKRLEARVEDIAAQGGSDSTPPPPKSL